MSRYLRWISNVRVWVGRGGRRREEGKEKGGEEGRMPPWEEDGRGDVDATLPHCQAATAPVFRPAAGQRVSQ